MPKRYAREFHRAVCDRRVAGEGVSKLSYETGVSPATLRLTPQGERTVIIRSVRRPRH